MDILEEISYNDLVCRGRDLSFDTVDHLEEANSSNSLDLDTENPFNDIFEFNVETPMTVKESMHLLYLNMVMDFKDNTGISMILTSVSTGNGMLWISLLKSSNGLVPRNSFPRDTLT
jgi:hypothetical protein